MIFQLHLAGLYQSICETNFNYTMVACDWFFNVNLTQVLIPLGKRASVLAAKGTVDIILRVVVNTSKDTSVCAEEILLLSHVILTKVGPKGNILYMPFKSIKEGSYISSKTFEFLESFLGLESP